LVPEVLAQVLGWTMVSLSYYVPALKIDKTKEKAIIRVTTRAVTGGTVKFQP
jgi:hypothetical protein